MPIKILCQDIGEYKDLVRLISLYLVSANLAQKMNHDGRAVLIEN